MQEPALAPNVEAPVDPTRVKNFAKFFKNYMSISAVLAAALPIPVTSFKLIPTYQAQTSTLATYTSLFCFLILGYIFYSRHMLARHMFPEFFGRVPNPYDSERIPVSVRISTAFARLTRSSVTVLPALLIFASLGCVALYHLRLDESFRKTYADDSLYTNLRWYKEAKGNPQSLQFQKDIRAEATPNSLQAQQNIRANATPESLEVQEEIHATATPEPLQVQEDMGAKSEPESLKDVVDVDTLAVTSADMLKYLDSWQIYGGHSLMLLYLGIFFSQSQHLLSWR